MLVDAVDAAVEAEVGLFGVGLEELVLTRRVSLSVTSRIPKAIRGSGPSSHGETTDIPRVTSKFGDIRCLRWVYLTVKLMISHADRLDGILLSRSSRVLEGSPSDP